MPAEIIRYYWEFGDGSVSAEASPTHRYEMPGTYTWVATIYRNDGSVQQTTGTIRVYQWSRSGNVSVSRTNRCFRLGFNREQGHGFSEVTGSGWPFPEARVGLLRVLDEKNYPHLICIDARTGLDYDIATYDGPSGSGLTEVHKDRVAADGTTDNAIDITPSMSTREDRGTTEDQKLISRTNWWFTRPYDEENLPGASGYDANGYPSGLTIRLDIFADGEQTTEEARARNIALPAHRITWDKHVEGHRIRYVLTANKAPFRIMARKQDYQVLDKILGTDSVETNEKVYQSYLSSNIALWVSLFASQFINRVTGSALSVQPSGATGVDDYSGSAMGLTEALTAGSVTITDGAVLVWYKGTVALTIGGSAVALTTYDTHDGWTLAYTTGVTASGAVVLTPTGTATVYDLRVFSSAPGADAVGYYFDDVDKHGGDVVLPRIE